MKIIIVGNHCQAAFYGSPLGEMSGTVPDSQQERPTAAPARVLEGTLSVASCPVVGPVGLVRPSWMSSSPRTTAI